VGEARVIVPDALKKTLKHTPHIEFAPSTPSGSFSVKSYDPLLWQAHWAEGLLLVGDLGRNSETTITIEKLVTSLSIPAVITKDAADQFMKSPRTLIQRPHTTLVISFSQLQKLGISLGVKTPFTLSMTLEAAVRCMTAITASSQISIITRIRDIYCAASGSTAITSPADPDESTWRLKTAAKFSVHQLHYPKKLTESLAHTLL
jgi:ADP-dependent NAD(P)H-hydrate dehydratase / NAD(P)H-hydrate epimerase